MASLHNGEVMPLEPRAYYNLLKYQFLQNLQVKTESKTTSWQVEDLRKISVETLLDRLITLGVEFDKGSFLECAEDYASPEDLTFELFKKRDDIDQIYLIIFEMWRRFLPEKVGLSIFCDELDRLIYLYDKEDLENDENLQDALASLLDILDENLDLGADAKKLFQSVTRYLGHDIEVFLYNYIFDQIESGNDLYADELIEGFYAFIKIASWFDFLRIKIAAKKDIVEANFILRNLIKELKNKPDLDLQIEILKFMVEAGDPELFVDLAKNTLPFIKSEEDFLELIEIVSDYYRRLDLEHKEKPLKALLSQLSANKEKETVKREFDLKKLDQVLKEFDCILSG